MFMGGKRPRSKNLHEFGSQEGEPQLKPGESFGSGKRRDGRKSCLVKKAIGIIH